MSLLQEKEKLAQNKFKEFHTKMKKISDTIYSQIKKKCKKEYKIVDKFGKFNHLREFQVNNGLKNSEVESALQNLDKCFYENEFGAEKFIYEIEQDSEKNFKKLKFCNEFSDKLTKINEKRLSLMYCFEDFINKQTKIIEKLENNEELNEKFQLYIF